jgi:hypothetical protein
VRGVLAQSLAVLRGDEKPTADLRALMQNLAKDQVPSSWRSLCHLPLSVSGWVADLARRVAQLHRCCGRDAADLFRFGSLHFALDLGCLFFPEAFVAGTRQVVAQKTKTSLELLELDVSMCDDASSAAAAECADSFVFTGATLFSAAWLDGAISVQTESASVALPPMRMRWLPLRAAADRDAVASASASASGSPQAARPKLSIPVYQDGSRHEYLFSMDLPHHPSIPSSVLIQRGVAIAVWKGV